MRNYRCRECETERYATVEEVAFGRVVCHACGRTCDPTPLEQERINLVRQRAREQRRSEVSRSIGSQFDLPIPPHEVQALKPTSEGEAP